MERKEQLINRLDWLHSELNRMERIMKRSRIENGSYFDYEDSYHWAQNRYYRIDRLIEIADRELFSLLNSHI